MAEQLQAEKEGSSGDCPQIVKTSDNSEAINNNNKPSQDDVETMITELGTENTTITEPPTLPMDSEESAYKAHITSESDDLQYELEATQLEIHPAPEMELEQDSLSSSPLNGIEKRATISTLSSEGYEEVADAYEQIPLSSPSTEPLHEDSYRNVKSIAFSSSPPAPENIALPPSSSPQWKEQHVNEDEEPSALDDHIILCNTEMTLSSSPELGQGSQDALSSPPPYNDLTDSTLVQLSSDDENLDRKESGIAYSNFSLRAPETQKLEEVYQDEPEEHISVFEDDETSAPSFPIHLPEIHVKESVAEPSDEINSSPQSSLGDEHSSIFSTKNIEPPRDINASKKRSYSDLDDSSKAPTPKRMTPSLAKKQLAKLSTPFRSPLVNKTHLQNISDDDRLKKSSLQPFPFLSQKKANNCSLPIQPTKLTKFPAQSSSSTPSRSSSSQSTSSANKTLNATIKASAQFKPPIMSNRTAHCPSSMNKSHEVQSLERKVQLLKRAVKIKNDEDEEKLAELVRKWKMAGREAAWDLWHIVREQQSDENTGVAYPGTNAKSISNTGLSGSWGWASDVRSSSAFANNWGFEEPLEVKYDDDTEPDDFPSPKTFEGEFRRALKRNPKSTVLPSSRSPLHGYQADVLDTSIDHVDHAPEVEEGEGGQLEAESKTLGTMLRQFGIAHETLGWVEDEGDFIDD